MRAPQPKCASRPASAGIRRVRRRRARRRAGRHRRGERGTERRAVLLVERYGFLGGMGTAAGVTNFCGLHANVHGEIRQVVHGVADELLDADARARRPERAAPRARQDPRAGLRHVGLQVRGRRAAGRRRRRAAVPCAGGRRGERRRPHRRAAARDQVRPRARSRRAMFIDCSGDGDLAHWAGAPNEKGDGDGQLLYPT